MTEAPRALITGIGGQDGSYLAEFLLEKGYEVCGMVRRRPSESHPRIDHLKDHERFSLHQADLTDPLAITSLIQKLQPSEIYNLGAQTHVHASFEQPLNTTNVDALGILNILEAVRLLGLNNTRIYQASTSELFGKIEEKPQNEDTPFHPYSPYAIAKQYAYWMVREYREAYGMWCCSGILFNHESPRRGPEFVTRKVTTAAARISLGLQDELRLGNLDSLRDWGHTRDYVECMWLMLQQDEPRDYVVATGTQHSVRELVELSFAELGIALTWQGEGVDEVGVDEQGRVLVRVDPAFFRPTEVGDLLGDPSRAIADLGWNPAKTSFEELVAEMVASDLALAKAELKASK